MESLWPRAHGRCSRRCRETGDGRLLRSHRFLPLCSLARSPGRLSRNGALAFLPFHLSLVAGALEQGPGCPDIDAWSRFSWQGTECFALCLDGSLIYDLCYFRLLFSIDYRFVSVPVAVIISRKY